MDTKIYTQVVAALRSACEDMVRFTGEHARPINAEYLLTVAVAKQIDKLNSYYGDPYKIYLEKKTKEFAKDCLLPVKCGNPMKCGSTKFRCGTPIIDRNGRIDIAIYQDVPNNGYIGHQPICAIELKGFNPARSLVLKDLKRNFQYFKLSGDTGGSVLKSTIFAALHSWSKTGDEAKEEAKVKGLENKYISYLVDLGCNPDVEKCVSVHSVSKDLEGEVVEEGEYQVLDTDTIHHFAGVLVEFRAKEI